MASGISRKTSKSVPKVTILKCGIEVMTKLNSIQGIITGISIRFNTVSYEISYFNGLEYKQIWMNEVEFSTKHTKKQTIGFKQ